MKAAVGDEPPGYGFTEATALTRAESAPPLTSAVSADYRAPEPTRFSAARNDAGHGHVLEGDITTPGSDRGNPASLVALPSTASTLSSLPSTRTEPLGNPSSAGSESWSEWDKVVDDDSKASDSTVLDAADSGEVAGTTEGKA